MRSFPRARHFTLFVVCILESLLSGTRDAIVTAVGSQSTRCEWEPAGTFQWSLIKKEALGYLQAAGEETAWRRYSDAAEFKHETKQLLRYYLFSHLLDRQWITFQIHGAASAF